MHSKYAMWAFYLSCAGLIVTLFARGKYDGVAFLFSSLAIVSIFVYNYLEVRAINEEQALLKEYFALFEQPGISPEVDNSIPLCSTCHQPMDTPGCCTSPESKLKYPNGFHILGGGCEATFFPTPNQIRASEDPPPYSIYSAEQEEKRSHDSHGV